MPEIPYFRRTVKDARIRRRAVAFSTAVDIIEPVTTILVWLEQTALSVWVRESSTLLAFPFILFLHTLGLGIVAGLAVGLDVWLLRFAAGRPSAPLAPFVPVIWLGFAIALVSGVLLLLAYPTKALTSPVFYAKIAAIAVALVQLQWLRKRVLAGPAAHEPYVPDTKTRTVAWVSIALWVTAIFLGRLLAYTYLYLMADDLPGAA